MSKLTKCERASKRKSSTQPTIEDENSSNLLLPFQWFDGEIEREREERKKERGKKERERKERERERGKIE